MDIYHKVFLVARRDQLHKAPLTPNYDGPRILDIGTGTGIWAIDMAESVDSESPDTKYTLTESLHVASTRERRYGSLALSCPAMAIDEVI